MIENIKFSTIIKGEPKNFIMLEKFSKGNKNYVIYQEEDKEELYASLYEIVNDTIKLIPIENDKDFDIVDKYLEEL